VRKKKSLDLSTKGKIQQKGLRGASAAGLVRKKAEENDLTIKETANEAGLLLREKDLYTSGKKLTLKKAARSYWSRNREGGEEDGSG